VARTVSNQELIRSNFAAEKAEEILQNLKKLNQVHRSISPAEEADDICSQGSNEADEHKQVNLRGVVVHD